MLTNRDKEILKVFAMIIPKMSDIDKIKLLSFGEGMAFMINVQEYEKEKNRIVTNVKQAMLETH